MQSLESFSRGPRAPPCTQTPSNYGHKGPMIAPKLPSTRCSNQHQLPLLSIGSGGSSSRKDILCAASTVSGASTSGRKVPPNFSITSKDGRWRIRLIDPTDTKEVQTVVKLQADGFHQPNPIPLLDTTFKRFFTAEVCLCVCLCIFPLVRIDNNRDKTGFPFFFSFLKPYLTDQKVQC